jgi:hypothetical protein
MPKQIPSYPFPQPQAGAIISEHTKRVGLQGLTDSINVVDRNGVLQIRDGMEYKETLAATAGGECPLGILSLHAQDQGTMTQDKLHVLTESRFLYNDGAWKSGTETQQDWATQLTGPDAEDETVVTTKVNLWFQDVDWSGLESEMDQSGTLKYLYVEIKYDAVLDEWRGRLYGYRDVGAAGEPYTATTPLYIFYAAGPTYPFLDMVDTNIDTRYEFNDGGPSGDGTGTQTYFGCGVSWNNPEMTDIQLRKSGNALAGDATYQALIVRSGTGWPDGASPFNALGRDNIAEMTAWDYNEITHVIMATGNDGAPLLAFSDSDGEGEQLTSCGNPGICPKAETVAVAGQRLVAGNIAMIDSIATHAAMGLDNWQTLTGNVAYNYFPDSIVYSGTVLTGGHTTWFPSDIIRLADTPGRVICVKAMGTMMVAVYKSDAVYVLAVQSGLSAFQPNLRAAGISGAVGRKAVETIADNLHIFLARDGGLYLFDGGPPRSLGEQFRRWINREMDLDYAARSYLKFDPVHNELHVYYPHKGSNGRVRRGMIVAMSTTPYVAYPIENPTFSSPPSPYTDLLEVDWPCMGLHWDTEVTRAGDILNEVWQETNLPDSTQTDKYQQVLFASHGVSLGDVALHYLREGVDDGAAYNTNPIVARIRSGMTDFDIKGYQKLALEIEWIMDKPEFYKYLPIVARILGGQTNKQMTQLVRDESIDLGGYPPYSTEMRDQAEYFGYELIWKWHSPRPNILDPSIAWALDSTEWTTTVGQTNQVVDYTTDYKIGDQCVYVASAASTAKNAWPLTTIPVEAGTEYTVLARVKNLGAAATPMKVGIREYNAAGTLIGNDFPVATSVTNGAWVLLTHTYTVDALARSATIEIAQESDPDQSGYIIDDLVMKPTATDARGPVAPPNFGGAIAYLKQMGMRRQIKP